MKSDRLNRYNAPYISLHDRPLMQVIISSMILNVTAILFIMIAYIARLTYVLHGHEEIPFSSLTPHNW